MRREVLSAILLVSFLASTMSSPAEAQTMDDTFVYRGLRNDLREIKNGYRARGCWLQREALGEEWECTVQDGDWDRNRKCRIAERKQVFYAEIAHDSVRSDCSEKWVARRGGETRYVETTTWVRISDRLVLEFKNNFRTGTPALVGYRLESIRTK